MSRSRANDFLSNMQAQQPAEVEAAPPAPTRRKPAVKAAPAVENASEPGRAVKPAGRAGLKHIGGYFDPDTVEKVAVLRARLNLDNSALLKLAVDDLFTKHKAERAFAD